MFLASGQRLVRFYFFLFYFSDSLSMIFVVFLVLVRKAPGYFLFHSFPFFCYTVLFLFVDMPRIPLGYFLFAHSRAVRGIVIVVYEVLQIYLLKVRIL